jgi:hypothetical protein
MRMGLCLRRSESGDLLWPRFPSSRQCLGSGDKCCRRLGKPAGTEEETARDRTRYSFLAPQRGNADMGRSAAYCTATAQHGVRHRVPETDAADQPPPDPSAVSTDRGLLGSLRRPSQTEVSSCSSSRRHPRCTIICRPDWVSLVPPARSESAATSLEWHGRRAMGYAS